MRDIEGIDQAIAHLDPYWEDLHADFDRHNQEFIGLMGRDPAVLGQVLKCHLIIEHYLDRFLAHRFDLANIQESRLSFYQKASLLPTRGSAAAFVRPGILRLNRIRNDFGHRFDAVLTSDALGPIWDVLGVARKGVQFPHPIDAIQAFTTVACTWLIIPAPGLADVMAEAFAKIQIRPEAE